MRESSGLNLHNAQIWSFFRTFCLIISLLFGQRGGKIEYFQFTSWVSGKNRRSARYPAGPLAQGAVAVPRNTANASVSSVSCPAHLVRETGLCRTKGLSEAHRFGKGRGCRTKSLLVRIWPPKPNFCRIWAGRRLSPPKRPSAGQITLKRTFLRQNVIWPDKPAAHSPQPSSPQPSRPQPSRPRSPQPTAHSPHPSRPQTSRLADEERGYKITESRLPERSASCTRWP